MAGKGQIGVSFTRRGDVLAHEILYAYTQGLFPMAEDASQLDYSWYRPQDRGIIPLDGFHVSRSLSSFARKHAARLRFSWDQDFEKVIDQCANRETTWINPTIRDAFLLLHENSYTHSFETYLDGKLIGGVYGLALGGAFFGESMFSRATNGSKLALGAMVNDLHARGFVLYDTQFLTPHLASLGGIEISDEAYQARLARALDIAPLPIERGNIDAINYFTSAGIRLENHRQNQDG